MNSQSILSMVAMARTRANQQNSPLFSDQQELIPWTRDSAKQIYNILVQRHIDWYTVQRPLSLSAGREAYALPSDYQQMNAVYMVYNNGSSGLGTVYKEMLPQFQRADWGRYAYTVSGRTWPVGYRIQASNIYFTPVSRIDYNNAIELQYTPQWSGPLTDWSPFDISLPNGWDEWVVLDVMIKMGSKANLNVAEMRKDKAEVEKRVLAGASSRTAEPPKKKDIYAMSRGHWYSGTPGGAAYWAV